MVALTPCNESHRHTEIYFRKGNTQSSKDTAGLFPIDLVKGMEFNVVFYHNIENLTTEFVERYFYVGLSRAAFFLGVTS